MISAKFRPVVGGSAVLIVLVVLAMTGQVFPTAAAAAAAAAARETPSISTKTTESSTTSIQPPIATDHDAKRSSSSSSTSSTSFITSSSSSSSGNQEETQSTFESQTQPQPNQQQQQRHQQQQQQSKLRMPYVRQEDLPIHDIRKKWQSLHPGVEFVPAEGVDGRLVKRFLEQQDDGSTTYAEEEETKESLSQSQTYQRIYGVEPFSYGEEEYDEYQQAWRLLGFIIDCNPLVDDDYYGNSGSGDQGTEDGCARYVLWAAYVDMGYEGGGIGEYQYWDRFNNKWDTTACDYSGSSRCAKMDCHLENTHFSLLGFFKHKSYDDWMEQLFKHEGICVWTDEEYAFMQNAREAWPQGCIDSYTTAYGGVNIYYDVKPVMGGDIRIGLYTDTACTEEYSGNDSSITVENILGNFFINNGGGSGDNNYDFSGDTLDQSFDRWDTAFATFHTCHPCVAYDLENVDGSKYYDDDANNGGGAMFDCYDDADYTNVNQCMKFMAKTNMNAASFRDMSLGRYQGTLVATPLSGFEGKKNSWRRENFGNMLTYLFLAFSFALFLYGLVYFVRVKHQTNYKPTFGWNVKEPLVMA